MIQYQDWRIFWKKSFWNSDKKGKEICKNCSNGPIYLLLLIMKNMCYLFDE